MKKMILFFASIAMSVVVCAQELSLADLLRKPALKNASLYISGRQEIAREWGINDNGNSMLLAGNAVFKDLSYQNVGLSLISISYEKSSTERTIVFVFKDNGGKERSEQLINQIRTDFLSLGIELPKVKRGFVKKKDGLPSPYVSIFITAGESVILTVVVTGKAEPNFKM